MKGYGYGFCSTCSVFDYIKNDNHPTQITGGKSPDVQSVTCLRSSNRERAPITWPSFSTSGQGDA